MTEADEFGPEPDSCVALVEKGNTDKTALAPLPLQDEVTEDDLTFVDDAPQHDAHYKWDSKKKVYTLQSPEQIVVD
jgi:hypothetical protein